MRTKNNVHHPRSYKANTNPNASPNGKSALLINLPFLVGTTTNREWPNVEFSAADPVLNGRDGCPATASRVS
jgi:hypothetical protein